MSTLTAFAGLPIRVRSRNRNIKPAIKQNSVPDKDKSINVADRNGLSIAPASMKATKKTAHVNRKKLRRPASRRDRLLCLLAWRMCELFVGILLFLCFYLGLTALLAFLSSQFAGFAFGYITVIWIAACAGPMRAFLEAMHD